MKNRKLQFLPALVLLLSVLSWMTAHAQITPLGDAYTNSADPTTNYGSATLLYVDGAKETAYIQFNLASIPSGAVVSQATLKLYVNAVTTAGTFNVDYVNGSWSESTLTYDLAPALGSTIVSSVDITTADKNQYILINITPAVQAWLNGSEANDGIALVANSTFSASFDSKENTTTSHPAELDIVFAGDGTITGVTTASGSGMTGGGTSGTLNLGLTTECSANQVLQWSGSAWACASAGTGTITGVTAGTALTGGGTSGNVTLNLNTSEVPLLTATNNFLASQTVSGNLSATGVVTGSSFQIGSNLFGYGSYADVDAFLGFAGNGTTTGSYDTASGYDALTLNTTGKYNTAIGDIAGQSLDQSDITGSNNSFLGAGTALSTGTLSNATAIGSNAEVAESNALVLGAITGVNGGTSVNVGIGTTTPQYALDVHGTGNFTGVVTFSSGQTFPGAGTVTSVSSGAGLTGGPITGTGTLSIANGGVSNTMLANSSLTVSAGTALTGGGPVSLGGSTTLNVDTTKVPLLAAANNFTTSQAVTGNLTATGAVVSGSGFQIGGNLFDYGSYASADAFLGFAGNGTAAGTNNTASGYQALYNNNTTAANNTASGYQALYYEDEGSGNTGIGAFSFADVTGGNYNTAVGLFAGQIIDGATLANNNTFLGAGAAASTASGLTNATAIGSNAEVAESDALVLGAISGLNGAISSTNVGIGTASPIVTLDVSGGILHVGGSASPTTTAQGGYLGWNALTGGTGETDIINNQGGGSGGFAFMNTAPPGLSRATVLFITGTGSVGINTISPDNLLTVNGSADKPGGGSWGTFSDRRLKTLDGSFNTGLSQILKIHPVRYRYKEDNAMGIRDTEEHVGLVAQEVQKAIPEAVSENSKGYLLVNNDPIIWTMLNAIKEQQLQIQKQQRQIARLTGKVSVLEAALRTANQREKSLSKVRSSEVATEMAEPKPGRAMAR